MRRSLTALSIFVLLAAGLAAARQRPAPSSMQEDLPTAERPKPEQGAARQRPMPAPQEPPPAARVGERRPSAMLQDLEPPAKVRANSLTLMTGRPARLEEPKP